MARKTKAKAETIQDFDPPKAATAKRLAVFSVLVKNAARVATLEVTAVPAGDETLATDSLPRGAFVRLRIPGGVSPAAEQAMVNAVALTGTRAIKLERGRKPLVLTKAKETRSPSKTVQVVVAELVATANTRDREALREVVDSTMGRVGL